MTTRIDEITGLPYDDSPQPSSFVVTKGFLAFSIHSTAAEARAWITWKAPRELRDSLEITRM